MTLMMLAPLASIISIIEGSFLQSEWGEGLPLRGSRANIISIMGDSIPELEGRWSWQKGGPARPRRKHAVQARPQSLGFEAACVARFGRT